MFDRHVEMPAVMPTLSRGKHRNPRKGACFMEFASYLAGEQWSDHPRCTHPLLAEAARLVNDHTSDAERGKLAPMIPSVIGLSSDDIRVDAAIALACAQAALPVASMDRQQALAVSILASERLLDDVDDRPRGTISDESREALELAPKAFEWARDFVAMMGVSGRGFRRHAAPNTVSCAVRGIAHACVADPDRRMRDMLAGAIEATRRGCDAEQQSPRAPDTAGRARHPAARGSEPLGR
jgi:hypothetical protein